MFRIEARAIQIGATRRLAAYPRVQIRRTSQIGRHQAQAQAKRSGSNAISTDDVLKNLSKNAPKSKNRRYRRTHPTVIYTEDHVRSIYELPTATQYATSLDPAVESSRLIRDSGVIIGIHHEQVPRSLADGKNVKQCTLHMKVGDDSSWKLRGHGATIKEAEKAAALHAVCQFHKSGDLLQVLSSVDQYLDPETTRLRREANAKKDIIDYAARHNCLPVFSFHKINRHLRRKPTFRAHVSIPDLGLNGFGRGNHPSGAILAASISSKNAAEARHEETGAGTLLVKDYTNLTTHSGEKFVRFYCQHQRVECSAKAVASKESETGGEWITEITLEHNEALKDKNGITLLKSVWKSISDSDAWPGVSQGEGDHERTYQGIPMMSRTDSEALGYLAAAIALKRESAYLWEKFVKEMRRGNGDILKPLSPIDIGIDSGTIEIMEDALQKAATAESQNMINSIPEDSKEGRTQDPRQLSVEDIEKKNEELKRRLDFYETHPSLTELRCLRLELPMTQHRDRVMEMVNGNDVCVIVGATGSGKTTQVPQLILDELIRKGKGGSCNIICTQPRRIAAVSVAQRVAVERNERLRQSIGYSVRFDSKPPDFGGSVHYLTTGVLLKQIQDSRDETLDGISHIIVDEVHERDLNNDFLLVVLKNLMKDRKAAGKPAIKVILMSATINTSLFCKYFGDGYPNKLCPHIEVPGRTFPVTPHYLDDIYSELQSTYSKDDAFDLYSRESQDYISRELESPPHPVVRATPDSDLEDVESHENKAMINWNSKGFISEDGEIDIAISRGDTVTPVRLMGVAVAHLLKTTAEGSILVFLPGLPEIIELEKQLNNTRPLGIDFSKNPDYRIYVLHSSLPHMQQDVFEKVGPRQRKIILATNIAETSVTIPDVVYVVDSSKQRETQYDRTRRIASLVSTWTAKSNAQQRAGRAGRVQHGHYYTMASKARYKSFKIAPKPEILRTDLQTLCLQIKSIGVKDIRGFLRSAIEPPGQSAVETSIDELQALGALDQDENLTRLGRYLSELPLAPSIGRMVVLGAIFRCLDPILILAASQTSKNPFLSPLDKREEAEKCHERWGMGTGSDHAAVINAFQEWRHLKRRGHGSWQPERQFAYANFLHHDTLLTIARTADQILDILRSTGLVDGNTQSINGIVSHYGSVSENIYSDSQALQVALATAGFYPNVAVRRKGILPRFLRTVYENEAAIFPYSLAAPKPASGKRYGRITEETAAPPGTLFTFCEKTQADDHGIFLRFVARTFPLAVYLFGGKSTIQGQVFTVDEWIPFYVRKREKFLLQQLKNMLQEFLERTFGRLRSTKENRRLEKAPSSRGENFLEQDKVRDPLVKGIVEALESCAPACPLDSRHKRYKQDFYDVSKERSNTELRQEFYSSSRSDQSIALGLTPAKAQAVTEDKSFCGDAEYKPHEIGARPPGFYKDEKREQILRGESKAARMEKNYMSKHWGRGSRGGEGIRPRSTVLDLLQKWNR